MPVIQISEVITRMGTSGELPDALVQGQMGFTTDTGEVFIGAADLEKVSGRKSYPYENIKILTEFDVQYNITGDVYYHGPIKTMNVPSSGGEMVFGLFKYDASQLGRYGRYDYSFTSTQSCQVGELNVILHGTTVMLTSTADTLGNISGAAFAFSVALESGTVNLKVTWDPSEFGAQAFRLHISGREWSANPPA